MARSGGWRRLEAVPGGPAVTELSVSGPSATVLAVTDGDPAIWVHDSARWRPLAGPRISGITMLDDGSLVGLEATSGGHRLVRVDPHGALHPLSAVATSAGPPVVDRQGRRVAWAHARPDDAGPVLHRTSALVHDRDGRGWLHECVRQIGVWEILAEAPTCPGLVTASPVDCREPCWSPDGGAVYHVRDRADDLAHDFSARIVALDVADGAERTLTEPEMVPAHPVVVDDGTVLFVALTHPLGIGGRADLLRLDPATGRVESHVPGGLDDLAHPLTALVSGLFLVGDHVVVPQASRGRARLLAVPTAMPAPARALLDEPVELAVVAGGAGGVAVRTAVGSVLGGIDYLADIVAAATPQALRPVPAPGGGPEILQDDVRLRAFTVPAGDGETVDAWLASPTAAADGMRYPPLVVWLHGGPMTQAGWSLPADVRTLLAYGIACLYPNYRGSSGRGAAYASAVAGRTGVIDLDDVLRVIDYVVDAADLEASPVGVQGSSYGGYLAGMLHLRDSRFAAAVLDRAITSWSVHRGSTDYGLAFGAAYGADDAAPDLLTTEIANRSPVLITAGELDRRCSTTEARLLFTRLREAGVPAELVVLPGIGHRVGAAPRPLLRERADLLGRWWTEHLTRAAETPRHGAPRPASR